MSGDDASPTPSPAAAFPVASASSSLSRPRAPPLSQASPLSASIPSLRRRAAEAQGEKAASATSSSVNERLARARQQAARRPAVPVEDDYDQAGQGGVAGGASGPAQTRAAGRRTSTPSSNTAATSASARAGLAYLAASALRTQDLEEARRNMALRRQLAGPVPPRSWKGEFLAGVGARTNGTGGSSKGASAPEVRQTQGLVASSEEEGEEHVEERAQQRRLQLQPWAAFHPLLPLCPSYRSAQRPTSTLRDICLSLILEVLATHTCSSGLLDQTTRLEIEEDAAWLPGHLKERIVALAARSGARCAMNDAAFEKLYYSPLVWENEDQDGEGGGDGEGDQLESESEAKTQKTPVEGSDEGDSDDWERGSDDFAQPSIDLGHGTKPHCWQSLDLSYAQLRPSTIRKLLLGPPPSTEGPLPNGPLTTISSNVTLRYLSLAGQDPASSPGLLIKPTFKLLASSLPNLEHLCLAGQHLALGPPPPKGGKDDVAPLPWPSLWRGRRKLRLLDLSYTTGLEVGAAGLVKSVVRDKGVTLPRLDHLLLKGSDADLAWFAPAGNTNGSGGSGEDVRGTPLPLFLTTSHTRHWAQVREKQRGRDAAARDAAQDEAIGFTEEDVRSSGAACVKQLASLALLMDTFRGRTGGGKERWCEIWI